MKNDLRKKQCKTESQVVIPALRTSNKTAFTLAEVLITLGIIGVVAALTIPALIQNHKEKVTVTAVKKVYSTLFQATKLAMENEGSFDSWESYTYENESESQNPVTRYNPKTLVKYLNVAKDCGFTSQGCFGSGYHRLDGYHEREFETLNNRYYKVVLSDGTSLAIEGYNPPDANPVFEIWVDVNGPKGPNKTGIDLFMFMINNVGKVNPNGTRTGDLRSNKCSRNGVSDYCVAWVLFRGNMDYLHCDDLSWNGKTSCK